MATVEKEIYTVSELTSEIKKNLESKFFSISVKGEVSNLKKQASGHIYFTLKDASSQISVALFHGVAKTMRRLPKDGDQICIRGEISLYAPRGTYQILARSIDFEGLGDLLLLLHKLKEELQAMGWFDPAIKKPLPTFPKTIGVVTSPTGAVIQDIIHVLERRCGGFHLILCPVKVQGPGAAKEIADGINLFNKHKCADVLIVGRGGGSLEDLWAFNEKIVAEAIFNSKIPIISAVGHETDFTIADFVADLRAPTPSAAAEIAMKERGNLLRELENRRGFLTNHILHTIQKYRFRFDRFKSHPKLSDPLLLTAQFAQKIDDISDDIFQAVSRQIELGKMDLLGKRQLLQSLSPLKQLAMQKMRLQEMRNRLLVIGPFLKRKKEQLQSLSNHLNALNPKNVLKKGYCIPFFEHKSSVVLSAGTLKPSQNIALQFHDGEAEALITNILKG